MAYELSVVVPVLNEEGTLPELLRNFAAQRGCHFEVIFGDGGSQDATLQIIESAADRGVFPVSVAHSAAGRGRQMNSAARLAHSDFLLFLHADSLIHDPDGFVKGLRFFQEQLLQRGNHRLAARFALRFSRQAKTRDWAYFFYEEKARLDLPGCIHGDQGWLLPRRFFAEVGPFDESLPIFEDEKLAAKVHACGDWLLLPVELSTSARRFEKEGLRERQTLNALLMNFHHIGWTTFLEKAPQVYRQQENSERLDLEPFFSLVDALLEPLDPVERQRLWLATGRYVRSQAWQPLFALKAAGRFILKQPPRQASWGKGFTAFWERLTDRTWINYLVGHCVKFWFYRTLARLRRASP
jgi:rSAM/selenodomain-associated transferase 2